MKLSVQENRDARYRSSLVGTNHPKAAPHKVGSQGRLLKRIHGQVRARLLFFRSLKNNFKQTGALIPSSVYLGQTMREVVDTLPPAPIIELGAGTGAITAHLADLNPVAVEIEAQMCRLLSQNFAQISVHQGCAMAFLDELKTPSGLVVSLPLINNPLRPAIVASLKNAYARGVIRWCVIYTYGRQSPLGDIGFVHEQKCRSVLRNLPPARVWAYY